MKVREAIRAFLHEKRDEHNGVDLLDRWNPAMETQVKISSEGGKPVEGRRNTFTNGLYDWFNIRVPKNADTEPEFKDYELRFPLSEHVEGIGSTGWDWEKCRSRWVGFDFDSLIGHAARVGITETQLAEVAEKAKALSYVEIRKSTGGNGLHLYVYFEEDGIPTKNHTQHAELARCILGMMSSEVGFDFSSKIDACGGNMWIWHRKMTKENEGLKLLKTATKVLSASELPENWRDLVKEKVSRSVPAAESTTQEISHARRNGEALAACRRITMKDGKDGSRRLFALCCRIVEHDCSDVDAIAIIRNITADRPFPKLYGDDEIIQRLRSAERKCERGSALLRLDKPEINVSTIDLAEVNDQVWKHIIAKNDPPKLFRFGGQPSRIERDDDGHPIIRSADYSVLRHHVANWIYFFKENKEKGEYPVPPPQDVINDVLATPDMPLPILNRIVNAPVFGHDGTLLTKPGYHPSARTIYLPSETFCLPEVSGNPTEKDIKAACTLLVDDLLGDFPFVSDAERAHIIALCLLPFARGLIAGPTPLHLFEKPSPGTGASLAVDCLHYIATGRHAAMMSEGREEDEWRKRITAKLRGGPQYLVIDNIKLPLESAAVAAALTAPEWEDRVLGTSQVVRLPIQTVWIATGNNPVLSDEIARRTLRIRIDAKMDQPWLRHKFKHPDLRDWVATNRGRLVHACLTIIQGWLSAEQPAGKKTLGMYESWSKNMGGILEFANIPGFLGNLQEFYSKTDAAGALWRQFMLAWWTAHQDKNVSVATLFPLATKEVELPLGTNGDKSQRTKLGMLIAENRERVYNLETNDGPVRVRLDEGTTVNGSKNWFLSRFDLAV